MVSNRISNTSVKALVALLFMTSTHLAYAVDYCTGAVGNLGIKRNGQVSLSGPGGMPEVILCELDASANSIAADTCKAIYSTLLAAKSQGREVRLFFSPAISSCSGLTAWNWASGLNWVYIRD